jgi:uncharacterized protein (DUF1800 family)
MANLHPLLHPFQPTSDDPFDIVKAAHLLNRAGFGGTEQEIARVMEMGPQDAIDAMMDFPDSGVDEETQSDVPDLSAIENYPKSFAEIRQMTMGKTEEERKAFRQKLQMENRQAIVQTIGWWLNRMTRGPYPMQEKLTLFWHGHFTTSAKDERAAILMWNQNELLRRNAAGNFRTFVRQVSRDPAMLDYLNNNENRKAHPNENYARELMELFTLGIGNYTEDDVKQGARAFTGWAHDGDEYVFRRFQHDDGEKTFLGKTGNFNGDDVIDIILAQPACSKFISRELFNYFAYEDIEEGVADSLAEQLRENKWELRPTLRTLFTSKAFYSDKAIGSQIKSPVQLVAGTVRMLGLETPQPRLMMSALNQMGQVPFTPPNVKGWPGGRMWINTSTLFVRYNTAVWLAGGAVPAMDFQRGQGAGNKLFAGGGRMMMEIQRRATTHFDPKTTGTPDEIVDAWLARLIQRPIEDPSRQVLVDSLKQSGTSPDSIRKMVQLIVSMPEYQLC